MTDTEVDAFLKLYEELTAKQKDDNPKYSPQSIANLKDTFTSGNVVDVGQMHSLLSRIDKDADPKAYLPLLFGDLNYDGKITNAGEAKKGKHIDQGTLMGRQFKELYDLALKEVGEEKLVQNIVKILTTMHGGREMEDTEKNATKFTELKDIFERRPGLLAELRSKLAHEPESAYLILTKGENYTTARLEQLESQEEKAKRLAEAYIQHLEINDSNKYAEILTAISDKEQEKKNQLIA